MSQVIYIQFLRNDENGRWVFDETAASLKYDALHAVLAALDLDAEGSSLDSDSGAECESASDKDVERKDSLESLYTNESSALFASAKNILANTDVQRYLGSKLGNMLHKYSKEMYDRGPIGWRIEEI